MAKKTEARRTADQRTRRSLRFSLLKEILRCKTVSTLPPAQKKWLFQCLSGGWAITRTSPDTPRIRALEKTASDARRLAAAVNGLHAKDRASLDAHYERSASLSTRLQMLKELEQDATALAQMITGKQKEIARIRRERTARRLVEILCGFGISCSTRHDYDVDDQNATTAMRCVLFSMIEGNAEELSWSTTISIIKLGLQLLTEQKSEQLCLDQSSLVAPEEADAFRLWRLEEPVWNGYMLET